RVRSRGPRGLPSFRANHRQGWRRRKYVVIQFEMREGEEADDRDDPGPKEHVDRVGRSALSQATPNLIKALTEDDATPWKHRERETLERDPPPGWRTVRRAAEHRRVLVEKIPIDERAAKPPQHEQEPWRGDGENQREAASKSEPRKQPSSGR